MHDGTSDRLSEKIDALGSSSRILRGQPNNQGAHSRDGLFSLCGGFGFQMINTHKVFNWCNNKFV